MSSKREDVHFIRFLRSTYISIPANTLLFSPTKRSRYATGGTVLLKLSGTSNAESVSRS
jgi:hypothetical protein